MKTGKTSFTVGSLAVLGTLLAAVGCWRIGPPPAAVPPPPPRPQHGGQVVSIPPGSDADSSQTPLFGEFLVDPQAGKITLHVLDAEGAARQLPVDRMKLRLAYEVTGQNGGVSRRSYEMQLRPDNAKEGKASRFVGLADAEHTPRHEEIAELLTTRDVLECSMSFRPTGETSYRPSFDFTLENDGE